MKQLISPLLWLSILFTFSCSVRQPSAAFIKRQGKTECVCFDRISSHDTPFVGDVVTFEDNDYVLESYQYGEFYEYMLNEGYATIARDFKTDSIPQYERRYNYHGRCLDKDRDLIGK